MKHKRLKARMFIGSVLLALPCLASASAADGTLLGELGAIGSYCSRLELPHDGAEAFLRELTRQFGAQTTGSAEFRNAYDLVSDALTRLDQSQGLALCGLGSKATPGTHENGRGSGR